MFNLKTKWISINKQFIFSLIALMLITSLAMSQALPLEEKRSEASIPLVLASEANAVSEESSASLSAEQAGIDNPKVSPEGVQEKMSDGGLLGMLALLVPHMAIAGGVIVCLAILRLIFRWRELVHQEHLLALEKGIQWAQISRQRLLLWGMVWVGLGLATGAALWVNFNWSNAMWSLMPLLLGTVLLIYAAFIEKNGTAQPSPSHLASTT